MKRKVALLTIHWADNAGAMLQAFAICKAVESLGHICEIIDYVPKDSRADKRKRLLSVRSILSTATGLVLHRKLTLQRERYGSFRSRLPICSPTFSTSEEIEGACLDYDVYLCGSDQIWNPDLLGSGILETYFLEFARKRSSRRISYAPSFGAVDIPVTQRARMAELIRGFDALSVREMSGVQIVAELLGETAEHVLDPTLLVSSEVFDEVADMPRIDRPYMLVYPRQYPKNPEHVEIMRSIARERGLRMMVVMPRVFHPRWLLLNAGLLWDIGPSQLLGLIKKAAMVCTNSYHGTTLSIAYKKDFVVIPHSVSNTRIESVLSILGLGPRQLPSRASSRNLSPYLEPVNYTEVAPFLANERQKSHEFLRQAIDVDRDDPSPRSLASS